jgi:hypothetical protein
VKNFDQIIAGAAFDFGFLWFHKGGTLVRIRTIHGIWWDMSSLDTF